MEEVWKNINITSLPNTPIPHSNHKTQHDPNPRRSNYKGMIYQDFLNCNPTIPQEVVRHEPNNYQTQSFSAFGHSNVLTSLGGTATATKKRSSESNVDEKDVSVDRRHKRMIKNRESASRSRARKQAYITELELEVAHLVQENARLRKQQLQLLEAASTQIPKKKGLYRTTTAPF